MTNIGHIIAAAFQAQLQTRLYFIPVLLGLGIALYFVWGAEPNWLMPFLLACLFLAIWFWLRGLPDVTGYFLPHQLILLSLMWVCVGFGAAKIRAEMVWSPVLSAPLGPVYVSGNISSLERLSDVKGARLVLDQLQVEKLSPAQTPKSVRLNVRGQGPTFQVGARISVLAKIEPPSLPTTPGGFDYRRHAYFKQIGGYGYALGAPQILDAPHHTGWFDVFENLRNAITAQVNAALPSNQAGIVGALLTGERAAIDEDDWQALRDSGLAHLLAISGSNVDMVALIVFFMVRLVLACVPRLVLHYPIKKYAAVAAFIAALAYVLLILPSTPTARALITISIVLLAILLDRSPISLRLVAATATILLLLWPEQLLSPSFQLSFAAVTALVAVFELCGPWLKRTHRDAGAVKRLLIYVVGVVMTTAVATIATAPISAFHFQNLAVYGVIANMLAVPLMTFIIMPLAILSYVLMPLGLAGSTFFAMGVTSDWVLYIAHHTADLSGARLTPAAMPLSGLICLVVSGLIFCLGARHFKLLAVLPALAAIWIIATHTQPLGMISADGKIAMAHVPDGKIYTTSGRYARRVQGDWVRYWGGGDTKPIVIPRSQSQVIGPLRLTATTPPQVEYCVPTCRPVTLPVGASGPIAIYPGPQPEVIRPLGTRRLWH